MNRAAIAIPEKLFFKIGEVCELTGVQAHVLRYWESEFPMLAPQKNRAGQRTYRKRDVEMALRIRELLYDDQYTIAGAKKKLASEIRAGSKLKVVTPEMSAAAQSTSHSSPQPASADTASSAAEARGGYLPSTLGATPVTEDQRASLRRLVSELQELLAIINTGDASLQKSLKK
ncbi:MAG TPA: MerR family transcriptional regulator [Pyrinomonadaceae bacterium]|nr:MerR family transcriptional regulator [Pyrinomonadaceae bacterium]